MVSSLRGAVIASALLVPVGGCSDSPHRAGFFVSVSDPTVAARVAFVEVRIVEGGCTGTTEAYSAGFRPGTPAPAPPLLAAGTYGFEALARDESCNRIAFGCLEVELPRSEPVEVVMAGATGGADCEEAACDRGECGSAGECDGGACPPPCDGGVCPPPACDGGVCPPGCDGGPCPGLCDPYPDDSCPACDPVGFSIDLADESGATGNDVSIATDALGRVHATYYSGTGDAIGYASHDPEGWFVDRTLDGESGDVGGHADVELDGSGGAHVAYLDRSSSTVRYLYQAPGSNDWTGPDEIDLVANESTVSLAVEENGTAHVVAITDETAQVLYARATLGGAWSTERVGLPEHQPHAAAVAVADGTVHILYGSDDVPFLHHATRDAGGAWSLDSVTVSSASGRPGQNLALVAEPSGRLHAVFNTDNDRGLGYATRDPAGGWTGGPVPVPDSLRIRGELGLATAPSGDVHVTYYRDDGEGLSYVRRDPSGGWTVPATIRAGGQTGQFSSVAVGADGAIHVAFSEGNRRDLRYATLADGTWTDISAATQGDVGEHAAIAVDATGIVRIAHRDSAQRDLRMTCRRPGGLWQTDPITDVPDNAGFSSSIAIDPGGLPHVAYSGSSEQLFVAVRSAAGVWSSEMVDPGPNVSRETAMAFGPDGTQHVAYLRSAEVAYAMRPPGGAWAFESASTDGAYEVALAVGSDGVPHVAYRSRSTDELLYARRSDTGWLGAVIDPTRGRGSSVSLAVAPGGAVHAVHTSTGRPGTLYHAELRAGAPLDGWLEPVVIDADDENGESISVAVDAAGAVHVLYTHGVPIISPVDGSRTGTTYSLRYATRTGGAWSSPVVVDDRDGAGPRVAAVVDALGRFHGVYTRSQPGLMHVWKLVP